MRHSWFFMYKRETNMIDLLLPFLQLTGLESSRRFKLISKEVT